MSNYEDFYYNDALYCQLYIDVEFHKHARGEVIDLLVKLIDGKRLSNDEYLTDFGRIQVSYNDYYNDYYSKWRKMFRGNFLYFKFFLEIDPLPELPRDEYILGMKKLIDQLKAKGIRVVPTCAFEDELGILWREV